MLDPKHPFSELLRRDTRYKFEAYLFVFDALRYGQEKMGLGMPTEEKFGLESSSSSSDQSAPDLAGSADLDAMLGDSGLADSEEELGDEHHVTGQQLCQAIQRYAIEQYGLLSKSVLKHWGITSTGDFGEIVFNLIDIGQMRKTDQDRREDFDNVFSFEEAFSNQEVFSPQHCPVDSNNDTDQGSEA